MLKIKTSIGKYFYGKSSNQHSVSNQNLLYESKQKKCYISKMLTKLSSAFR